jgi:outer membrane protein OmpA-like peptidoglycan-associated protein
MNKRMMITFAVLVTVGVGSIIGCSWSNAVKGGAIGTGVGGAGGAVIGNKAGNTALGAIIGAAVGGTAGTLIGRHMDQQAAEMQRDIQGAQIERVGEGIKITFDSGILFDFDSAALSSVARGNIENLAQILNKYPDTNILVEGDTDDVGTDAYNQRLSERRAQAVADYQKSRGVAASRISIIGLGESNPVASNDTEIGRQQNRRVEVAIFANDKLKDAAKAGTIG